MSADVDIVLQYIGRSEDSATLSIAERSYLSLVAQEAALAALARLAAAAEQRDTLARAVVKARRELWWFIERDSGEGWGFAESDVDEIAARAMAIQDETLAAALAAVGATAALSDAGNETESRPGVGRPASESAEVAPTEAKP